jgi:N-acyl-D-aspartate/D-glutamate deacylase
MFGKNPRLNPLESRKQLLIAESELNRAQLVQEWQMMADGVRSIADRARNVSSLISAAALLIAGLAFFRRTRSAPGDEKPSWWQTLLKGATLAGSLWSKFRPRPKS